MSFHMSAAMDALYRHIKTNSTTGKPDAIEVYYYCLMIGMSHGKLDSGDNIKQQEFIKDFTSSFKSVKNEIIAALISTEIKRTGQMFTSENILNTFKKYVDLESSTRLNPDGEKLLDRYAEGGFKILNDFNPQIVEKMDLIRYSKMLSDNID